MALPYQNTSVSPDKSISQIKKQLSKIGFTKFAVIETEEIIELRAVIKSCQFSWRSETSGIRNKARKSKISDQQCHNISWRCLAHSVVAQVNNILCGASTISEEFGALALYPDGTRPAEIIAENIATGKMNKGQLLLSE